MTIVIVGGARREGADPHQAARTATCAGCLFLIALTPWPWKRRTGV